MHCVHFQDDDSMDKDGNELDGECSRPQKHAKSPELAREFLLDAATVIFKEQACSIPTFVAFIMFCFGAFLTWPPILYAKLDLPPVFIIVRLCPLHVGGYLKEL